MAIASRYPSFPIVLETVRECLRDVLDLPGLASVLQQVASKTLRVVTVDVPRPSPFARSVGDLVRGTLPLQRGRAPRRAPGWRACHRCIEAAALLGDAALAEASSRTSLWSSSASCSTRVDAALWRTPTDCTTCSWIWGISTEDEVLARSPSLAPSTVRGWITSLSGEGRIVRVVVAGTSRWVPVEDVARYRDALGTVLPPGIPGAFLEASQDPLGDLLGRFARTHGPFLVDDAMARFGLPRGPTRGALEGLVRSGRLFEGRFRRGSSDTEYCDAEVLRRLKRMSLDALRREVEPVSPAAFSRFLLHWHGAIGPAHGARERRSRAPQTDALLAVIDQLQGAALLASELETSILPARLPGYVPSDLDALCARGDVTWLGLGACGPHDAKIALFLTENFGTLAPPPATEATPHGTDVRRILAERGALFFADMVALLGGFVPELLASLWDLVLAGEVTNDTLLPLRRSPTAHGRHPRGRRDRRDAHRALVGSSGAVARSAGLPGSEGRWSLVRRDAPGAGASETQRRIALTTALLRRHGVVTREAVVSDAIVGGFSPVYGVLRGMERGRPLTPRVLRGGPRGYAVCAERCRGAASQPSQSARQQRHRRPFRDGPRKRLRRRTSVAGST